MTDRRFKDTLYEQFARIGHAVSSPRRLELLDLLGQGEKTVEALAEQSATGLKNTSAHLRVLRAARLVDTRKDGPWVYYRLADEGVFRFVRELEALGRGRLAEIERAATEYIDDRDALEPITLTELRRRMRAGSVTVIDVRPEDEYRSAHIPGALSIPVAQLAKRLPEVPRSREVVAYCRGPYCVYAVEAVEVLRKHGYRARRSEQGLPDWRAAGYPVRAAART